VIGRFVYSTAQPGAAQARPLAKHLTDAGLAHADEEQQVGGCLGHARIQANQRVAGDLRCGQEERVEQHA